MLIIFAIILCVALVGLCLLWVTERKSGFNIKGRHIVISGGSSGIGKALAVLCVKSEANVTILARNQSRLDDCKILLERLRLNEKQQILAFSVDVSVNYDDILRTFSVAEKSSGPIEMLINCAGTSVSGKFEDTPLEEFSRMISTNYISAVNCTKAVICGMKDRHFGSIVFVSSQAGQVGLFGYTSYSASKFALRGLAECLQMECCPYNISVTMSFPPDTDTPGFSEEQKSKPVETRLISDSAGLYSAETVAQTILTDATNRRFFSSIGLDGWMLSNLTAGMSPVNGVYDALFQILTSGLFRFISLFYISGFNSIVVKCKEREDDTEATKAKLS